MTSFLPKREPTPSSWTGLALSNPSVSTLEPYLHEHIRKNRKADGRHCRRVSILQSRHGGGRSSPESRALFFTGNFSDQRTGQGRVSPTVATARADQQTESRQRRLRRQLCPRESH